jgi:hypothetical protein
VPGKLKKKPGGVAGKLMAVLPVYRFAVHKKILAKRRGKSTKRGCPVVSGSFESGKRR